jgi:hypothetical protein
LIHENEWMATKLCGRFDAPETGGGLGSMRDIARG